MLISTHLSLLQQCPAPFQKLMVSYTLPETFRQPATQVSVFSLANFIIVHVNTSCQWQGMLICNTVPRVCTVVLSLLSLHLTEPNSFYTILVSHIHRMLRERENVRQDEDWILEEAMDMHHLQTGGTFKNVLTRKLDEIVVPCLAEIIAFMDRNCNLNLLQIVHPITPLSRFWLMMFGSQRSEEALRFADMVGRQKVPMHDEEFVCEFPFSWLVKELMDSQWDNAQATGG